MSEMLLAGNTGGIVFGAVGAAAALSLVYGVFKKGSRISWAGWEILIVFLITFIFELVQGSRVLVFLLAVGVTLAVTCGLYGAEAGMKARLRSGGKGLQAIDRTLGAVTSVVNALVLVAGIGGAVLYFIGTVRGLPLMLFQMPLWTNFLGRHVIDLLLVSILVGAVRGGYRLGLLKLLFVAAAMFVTGTAFLGSVYLTANAGFLKEFAAAVARGFLKYGEGVAALLGGLIVATLCFAVLFVVLVVLMWLANKPIKKLAAKRAFAVVDGTLLAGAIFILATLFVCGIYFGVYSFAQNVAALFGEAGVVYEAFLNALAEIFTSAPLSRIFFECNPFLLLAGG